MIRLLTVMLGASREGRRRYPWLWRLALAICAVYWGALFIATHLPRFESLGKELGDKAIHFLAYFGLGILLTWTASLYRRLSPGVVLLVVIVILAYAAADEVLQTFIPGRFGHILDWLADLAGTVVGVGCYCLAHLCARWQPAAAEGPTNN